MPALPQPISHTALAMDAALVAKARSGDSSGINMSSAAGECPRAIWYSLRWASPPEPADGKQQRRFRTGLKYEDWLLADLRDAGVTVYTHDDRGNQFTVELLDGYLRGKMDAVAMGLPEASAAWHVVECKTHGDRSFKELLKKKLREGKPEHFAQCQLYMHGEEIERALYIAVNKNDEELYVERVAYDREYCETLLARLGQILHASRPPAKLHDDPAAKAAFACGWCNHKGICHERQFARNNCRTCLFLRPDGGGKWFCEKHGDLRDYKAMQAGCAYHLYIPDLVPGEQVDVIDEIDETVIVYRLDNGDTWQDGPHANEGWNP